LVKIENFPNAYKEVYEILKYVPKEDISKIPQEFLKLIKKNMNKSYDFKINENIDFIEEQEIMQETKTILAYIFLNYWANDVQKETIKKKFKNDILEAENKRRELYNVDVFKNKNKTNENKTEKLEMIVYKKENIFIKIFNKIKRFFRIK